MNHSLQYTHTAGASILTKTVTETGDSEVNANVAIPTGTNQEVDFAFLMAEVKMFYIQSDKAVTLRTNANDATGGNSFALAAGAPMVWHDTGPVVLPFTFDVAKLFVQNASGQTANVSARALVDSTP